MSVERKRLESYVEEYEEESAAGMGLKVENYEGGNNMPDESEYYETRLDWLNADKDIDHSIWNTLAKGEYSGYEVKENEELVYLKFPQWILEFDDNEDWKRTFGVVYGYFTGWAILDVDASEGKKAWAFNKVFVNGRWKNPANKYSKIYGPRSCMTLYRREGEPDEMDMAEVRKREALPENVDAFEAEEDDYDWRLALGAAYRRINDSEEEPLQKAKKKANELPDKLYTRVEIGVDEYMRESKANGHEVSDDELALIIHTLATALEPGASIKNKKE